MHPYSHQCLASTSGGVLGSVGAWAGMDVGFELGVSLGQSIGLYLGGPITSLYYGMLGATIGACILGEAGRKLGNWSGKTIVNSAYWLYVKVNK